MIVILSGLVFLSLPLFLVIFYFFFKTRGPTGSFKRFVYHIKRAKLVDFENAVTYLVPFLAATLFFLLCITKLMNVDFRKNLFPYISLFPKSLFTPTTIIAIFGPTILALNYRLFNSQFVNSQSSSFRFPALSISQSKFIDARFDHTHQLNALIIAWGAFGYQILMSPLESLLKLTSSVDIISHHRNTTCSDVCLLHSEYTFGRALDQAIYWVQNDLISIVIVTLAIGFVVWTSIRLISGQLSKPEIVALYEKDLSNSFSHPPITSRITLYRYIFVFFSFLYLSWSDCYLKFKQRDIILSQCNFADSDTLGTVVNKMHNIPSDTDSGILLLLLLFFSFLTISIGLHFLANFKYQLKVRYSVTFLRFLTKRF